jgi:hypothetical protein
LTGLKSVPADASCWLVGDWEYCLRETDSNTIFLVKTSPVRGTPFQLLAGKKAIFSPRPAKHAGSFVHRRDRHRRTSDKSQTSRSGASARGFLVWLRADS